MRDVQHTHPYTGESFQTAYTRGPVVSDGGAGGERGPDEETHPSPRTDGSGTDPRDDTEAEEEEATDPAATADPTAKADPAAKPDTASDADQETLDEEMRDVDHTPPDDDEGANRVWERGAESRDRNR